MGDFYKENFELKSQIKENVFLQIQTFFEIKYKLLFSNSNLNQILKIANPAILITDQFLPDLYSKDISTNLKDGVDIIQTT